ncbi:MAG: TetR/AcrR family transcriptional regulator [Ruminococcaceae bacterium]|nr:TetR/AcrR family transcriptional regulator [Oscillospiraceae bacterium]
MSEHENPMSIRSKNALSGALLKLMMTTPFKDITISDITHRARLSRQTFYTNFSKKEDILHYLVEGLFCRYSAQISELNTPPSSLLVEYFFYWDLHRDFLSLLFCHGLGEIFQEHNRKFFTSDDSLNSILNTEEILHPYIRASLAGLTYELLWLWLTDERGLSIDDLTILAKNLLAGNIFV